MRLSQSQDSDIESERTVKGDLFTVNLGRKEGRERGRKEGREEGREEGKEEEREEARKEGHQATENYEPDMAVAWWRLVLP